jgi:hypothetical protein
MYNPKLANNVVPPVVVDGNDVCDAIENDGLIVFAYPLSFTAIFNVFAPPMVGAVPDDAEYAMQMKYIPSAKNVGVVNAFDFHPLAPCAHMAGSLADATTNDNVPLLNE